MSQTATEARIGCGRLQGVRAGLGRSAKRCKRYRARLRQPTEKKGFMLSVEIALPDIEELHKLVEQGQEKGFLTYDEIVNALEDVELTKEQLEEFTTYAIDHSIELVEGEQHKRLPHEPVPGRRGEGRAEARPQRRAVTRLAPALPARDRQGPAPDRLAGGRAREADRARRHGGQAAHDRGEPASRRLDREGLPRPRALVPRPDPGGVARA